MIGIARRVDKEVFRTTAQTGDYASAGIVNTRVDRNAQGWITDTNVRDALIQKSGLNAAKGGLNFRKFRHP